MGNASKLPLAASLYLGQWSNPDAPAPKLAAPIDDDDTTITVTQALKDSTGTVVTGAFLFGAAKANGYTETIWCPAGGASADGLTLTGCVRGIKPNGIDFTVGDSDFAASHSADEPVFVVIPAIVPELLRSAVQGLIATGAVDFVMGTEGGDGTETITIYRTTGAGTKKGFLRWYTTNGKAQYSNDGSSWVSFDDTVSSVLVKATATDTTAGYVGDKIQAGSNVTVTLKNSGGNEYYEIAASLSGGISSHSVYTPAYLTCGAGGETDPAIWDSVSDGSFRVTIDGTAYNVDGIDFTPQVGGDMDDMAGVIQAAIRAVTSSTETVTWSTDHFIITSADTTSSSEVSVLETSTGTVGTDISGAGASNWMDGDTGNGTATSPVLDPTADAGKNPTLEADGDLNRVFIRQADYFVMGEAIDGSSTPQAVFVSDGSNSKTAGYIYKADADDLTNMAVRAVGFVTDNLAQGDTGKVQFSNVVDGFTGLTQGVDYYLSTTAGGISKTVTSNPAVKIGRAISATELLIERGDITVMSYASTATGLINANDSLDVAITIGFRPKALIAHFFLNSTDDSLAWGQWSNGTQNSTWTVNDAGTIVHGSDTSTIGQIYRDYGGADYWEATINTFTDNTITLRYTAKGGNLSDTIISNLLIFG